MSNPNKIYDVAIVGAGVMGSSTAYYLSKSTTNIILLEQFDFLHRKGSSHGDSRIIRMTYPQGHYTELMTPAYSLWSSLEQESSRKLLTPTGGLDIGHSTNPELLQLISTAKKYAVPYELLNPSQLSAKFPILSIENNQIALYSPSSGILNATKAVATFQSQALKRGITLKDNCKVEKVTKSLLYSELVTSTGQIVRARKVIFTTGPWTKKILKENLGLDLPLRVEQTTVAYWKVQGVKDDEKDNYSSKKLPVWINYDKPLVYGTPSHEFEGLIKCSAHYGEVVEADPDKRDFEPGTKALQAEVGPFLKSFFKGKVSEVPLRTESCVYTWTPDYDFVVDEVEGMEGWFVGCGFSGHGFKLATVVGHMLSEMCVKGTSPYPGVKGVFGIRRFGGKEKAKF